MSGHPWQWYGGHTYAQHGEDLILLNIFKAIGIERPSYLDIGAHDPFVISNTALLYESGSRGINVDANAHLIEAFRKARPGDINLAVGVASEPGRRTFYAPSARSGLSSFLRQEVEGHGHLTEIEVEVTTVNAIVDEHAGGVFPHILSIDAEGMDMDIVRSLDLRASRPDVIVAEARAGAREMARVLAGQDYAPVFRAGSNTIFLHEVHRDWMFR